MPAAPAWLQRGNLGPDGLGTGAWAWGSGSAEGVHVDYALEALEAILARATVPILRQVEERPPELVVALLPSLIRIMLAAFVEAMAEQRSAKA